MATSKIQTFGGKYQICCAKSDNLCLWTSTDAHMCINIKIKHVTSGFHGPEACHSHFHGTLLWRHNCKIDPAISVSLLHTMLHCNAVMECSAVTTITTAGLYSERNPPILNKGGDVCAKPPHRLWLSHSGQNWHISSSSAILQSIFVQFGVYKANTIKYFT